MHSERKTKKKRILAALCIVLILSIYLFTFIMAVLDFPGSGRLFRIGAGACIIVPVMTWFYIWIYGKLTHRKTIADIYTEQPEAEEKDR